MSIKKLALAGGVAASLMAGTAYASVIDRPFFQVLGVVVVWGADGSAATANAPVVSDFVLLTPASGSAGADLIAGDVNTVVTGSLTPVDGTSSAGGTVGSSLATNATGTPAGGNVLTDVNTNGVLDAGDTLTAFGLDATTDVGDGLVSSSHTSSFYVASNAAFDIFAEASNLQRTGSFADAASTVGFDDISLAMSVQSGTSVTDGTIAFGGASQNPGNVLTTATTTLADAVPATATPNGLRVFEGTQRTAASVGNLAAQSVRFDNVYTFGGAAGYDLSMGAGTVAADVTYTIFVP